MCVRIGVCEIVSICYGNRGGRMELHLCVLCMVIGVGFGPFKLLTTKDGLFLNCLTLKLREPCVCMYIFVQYV